LYSSALNFANGAVYGWKTATLSSSIYSQIVNRRVSPGWIQLGLTWASGGTSFAYHYGQENSTNKCYLAVTYTTSTYSYDASVSNLVPNTTQRPCSGLSPVSVTLTNNTKVKYYLVQKQLANM
jgi:hypothetical protein